MTNSPAQMFFDATRYNGIDLYTGVPCSYLAPLFAVLENNPKIYRPCPREDSALALAAGAYLAGVRSIVLMQNSGFAQSINVLASLIIPYRIPCILVVSWRGEDDNDSQEHGVLGRSLLDLVSALQISVIRLSLYGPIDTPKLAIQKSSESQLPVIILVKKDDF